MPERHLILHRTFQTNGTTFFSSENIKKIVWTMQYFKKVLSVWHNTLL